MEQLSTAIDSMIEGGMNAAEVIGYLELLKHDLVLQVLESGDDEE